MPEECIASRNNITPDSYDDGFVSCPMCERIVSVHNDSISTHYALFMLVDGKLVKI